MTIDQMNEIADWLSPIDKYGIKWELESTGSAKAEATIKMPSQFIFFYFDSEQYITVENGAEAQEAISNTTVWEQICLRNL